MARGALGSSGVFQLVPSKHIKKRGRLSRDNKFSSPDNPAASLVLQRKVSLMNKTLTLSFGRVVVGYPSPEVPLNASGTSFASIPPEKAEKALSHQGDVFMNSGFFPDPRSGEGSVRW